MRYKRTGKCNLCGECCGFPRATDGGQSNAWPLSWPESLAGLTKEDKDKVAPVFRITGNVNKSGIHRVGKKSFPWEWVKEQGLCKVLKDGSHDIRCPFLSDKQEDGTVPCGIYGTRFHSVWEDYCNLVPPEYFEQAQLDNWQKNCPSCSFVFVPEE